MKNINKKTHAELSREKFYPSELLDITNQDIQVGSIIRIAEAVEKMATPFSQLINDADKYKKWYFEKVALINKRDRQISALRGVITRLKNKNK